MFKDIFIIFVLDYVSHDQIKNKEMKVKICVFVSVSCLEKLLFIHGKLSETDDDDNVTKRCFLNKNPFSVKPAKVKLFES